MYDGGLECDDMTVGMFCSLSTSCFKSSNCQRPTHGHELCTPRHPQSLSSHGRCAYLYTRSVQVSVCFVERSRSACWFYYRWIWTIAGAPPRSSASVGAAGRPAGRTHWAYGSGMDVVTLLADRLQLHDAMRAPEQRLTDDDTNEVMCHLPTFSVIFAQLA